MWLAVPRTAYLLALLSVVLQSCQAQTDHRSGWLSSIAAQLLDGSGRNLLGESDHRYDMHDPIKLYANKVGPFSNPRYATWDNQGIEIISLLLMQPHLKVLMLS